MHGSMQNVAPVINQPYRGGKLQLAFLSAIVSLVVSFAAAAAPIPLYNTYRAENGLTNAGISMAIVAYAAENSGRTGPKSPTRQFRHVAVIVDATLKRGPSPRAAVAHICQPGCRTAVP